MKLVLIEKMQLEEKSTLRHIMPALWNLKVQFCMTVSLFNRSMKGRQQYTAIPSGGKMFLKRSLKSYLTG